jgi:uncharacterized membrane protein YkoI
MRPLLLLSLVCGVAITARADDTTVALSDVPATVQNIIQTQIAGGTMGDITKSTDDEETVYDVDLTAKDGSDRDFSVAQDGTLLNVELPLAETPDAVRKAVQAELSTVDTIDKNLADSEISYDIKGTGTDGTEKDFTVADDGSILSREIDLTNTPDAVQKSIAAQLAGSKIASIDENFDDDGTNFDVTVTAADGPDTSFNLIADGALASRQVSLAGVPCPVQKTIRDRLGDGTVLRVDKSFIERRGVLPFEIEGRKDGKPFDFAVGPRGRFLGMDD